MKRFRRALLEIWFILPMAVVVGFMGPFGTYTMADFFTRTVRWWAMLMGAYLLMRPAILFWLWIARATRLPQATVVFWGLVLSTFPIAYIWRLIGPEETRLLGDYAGVLPFTLLSTLAVMAVVWWAERADAFLLRFYSGPLLGHLADYPLTGSAYSVIDGAAQAMPDVDRVNMLPSSARPRLYARLSPGFEGNILALESEDHYVRVHGVRQSELLLMRLRDAIAEMDAVPGEQTHRSWWVARNAVAGVIGAGRNREIRLANGTIVPVARDSVERLQRSGFLPA